MCKNKFEICNILPEINFENIMNRIKIPFHNILGRGYCNLVKMPYFLISTCFILHVTEVSYFHNYLCDFY